jgi:hypothetical protein
MSLVLGTILCVVSVTALVGLAAWSWTEVQRAGSAANPVAQGIAYEVISGLPRTIAIRPMGSGSPNGLGFPDDSRPPHHRDGNRSRRRRHAQPDCAGFPARRAD